MKRKTGFTDIAAGLCLALLLFSFAVVFTLNFRPLYYWDIQQLNIPALSGLAEEEIRENYQALIAYNSLFYRGALSFPTLPMSESGRIHFEEVKVIFDGVQLVLLATLCISVPVMVGKLRKRQFGPLLLAGLFSFGVPLLLGLLIAINWQAFFETFHRIFFNNEYWVFDPVADPVINILPDAFFMHCALMILCLVLAGGLAFLLAWLLLRRRESQQMPDT